MVFPVWIAQYDCNAAVKRAVLVRLSAILLAATLGLAACGSDNPSLLNIRQQPGEGPDEFGILPTKPLAVQHRQTVDINIRQGFLNGFQLRRLDDGDNQFHGAIEPKIRNTGRVVNSRL